MNGPSTLVFRHYDSNTVQYNQTSCGFCREDFVTDQKNC